MKKAENSIMAVLILILSISMVLPMAIAQTESATPIAIEVNITGPHAVFFNVSGLTPIENGHRLVIQGTKTSTVCKFPPTELTITPSEGNISKIERELAVDPDTCQILVEQGTIKKSPNIPNPSEIKIISTNSAQTYFPGTTKQAQMTTNWWDPVPPPLTQKVSYVYDQLNFNYDGTYVYANWAGYSHWGFPTTHWYDVSFSHDNYLTTNTGSIYSRMIYDHWENDWFGGVTTNIYYQPNSVRAYPSGSVLGTSVTWDDGPIAWMLHYEKILTVS